MGRDQVCIFCLSKKESEGISESLGRTLVLLCTAAGCRSPSQQEHHNNASTRDAQEHNAHCVAGAVINCVLVFELGVAKYVANEPGGYLHGPEDARIDRDCLLIRYS